MIYGVDIGLYDFFGIVFGLVAILLFYKWYDWAVNKNPFAFNFMGGIKKKKIIFFAPNERKVDWEDKIYEIQVSANDAYIPELRRNFRNVQGLGLEKKEVIFGYKIDMVSMAPLYLLNVPILANNYDEFKEVYAKSIAEIESKIESELKAQSKDEVAEKILTGKNEILKQYGAPAMLFYGFGEYGQLLNIHKEKSAMDTAKKDSGVPESLGDKIQKNASVIFIVLAMVMFFVMSAFFAFSATQKVSDNLNAPLQLYAGCNSDLHACQLDLVKCAYGNFTVNNKTKVGNSTLGDIFGALGG